MLPGKKLDFEFVLAILRRRAAWLVGPPALGLFAALVISATLPNMYRSETLMRLIPQRVPDSYVRSTVNLPIATRLDSVSRQVLSRTQIEQLMGEFDLYSEDRARFPMQDVVNKMRSAIEVEIVPPSRGQVPDAFHIRFTDRDPVTAARVTDRLAEFFVDENARDRGDVADATNQFLESQLADARARLETQERKLEQFRQRHAGRLPSQLDSNSEAVHNAQMQVQSVVESAARDRDRKLMLERLYRDADAEPPPMSPAAMLPAATAANGGQVNVMVLTGTTRQQLETARATLAALQLRLTPEHPDILRTKRQIAELEAQIPGETAPGQSQAQASAPPLVLTPEAAQRSGRLGQMRAELESLDRQLAFKEGEEQRLRRVIADYQKRIEASPGLESEWAVLNRDYETLSDSYKELLGKSEESKVAADLEKRQIGEQFRVVDSARVPSQPISPLRTRINAVGFALGLALGLMVVAVLEWMDTSFRTRADVMDTLSLPVLARVPLVESAADQRRRHQRKLMTSVAVIVLFTSGVCVFWAMGLWKYVV